ncbi:hypothetical protein BH10BAC5_BH10BAC5_25290 [soil metagenome]
MTFNSMNWSLFTEYYFRFWYLTIPVTIKLTYFVVTELLDLFLNSKKVKLFQCRIEKIQFSPLQMQYELSKNIQSKFSKSILMELERRINYIHLMEKVSKKNWMERTNRELKENIITAKRLSDIFQNNH